MKSLTHSTPDKIVQESIIFEIETITDTITQDETLDALTKDRLLVYLHELSKFELGRFLIKNRGALSGYWTNYIISGFTEATSLHPLEKELITTAPTILATRQRFYIFQSLLLNCIKSNTVICSVPCGVMADLLTLNLSESVDNIHFVGIDFDQASLDLAHDLAIATNKSQYCQFFKENAWDLGLNHQNQFDVITSNGLNIYEANDDKVTELYKAFCAGLKSGGKLIGSALSQPQEWVMSKISPNALNLQRDIFIQILQATWSHFRAVELTIKQLKSAGFGLIEIHWDEAHMFYSFVATRI